MTKWELSIVMAAYNEAESLPVCVSQVLHFLKEHAPEGELITDTHKGGWVRAGSVTTGAIYESPIGTAPV